MKTRSAAPVLSCLFFLALYAQGVAAANELPLLRAASQDPVSVTLRENGAPLFVRGKWAMPATTPRASDDPLAAARGFLAPVAADLRIDLQMTGLLPVETKRDGTGRVHLRLAQTFRGVPVYGAQVLLHYLEDERTVYAVNGRWARRIDVETVPQVTPEQAVAQARSAFPGGGPESEPRLVVVTDEVTPFLRGEHLAWEVVLGDTNAGARRLFLVDARDGSILIDWNRIATARDRKTHDAGNLFLLPGTLVRSEGDGPVGDQDVDEAHDFAGATYDYYLDEHGRDSLDDAGMTLVSTAHYGSGYANAFWNGFQMVYGDEFPTLDVCAHELTHGVTDFTAQLIYLQESGALNESFSDVFAAMVDDDDWLIGEDLPIGAIRSLSDPTAFGDPAHLDDYICTIMDNGGVHTNSGIHNKLAYLLATAASREVAGGIFYRSLVFYLFPAATYLDAGAATLNSALDLYGVASPEATATEAALDGVGMGAGAVGPACAPCPAEAAARAAGPQQGASLLDTAYRVRDELLAASPEGRTLTDAYYRLGPRTVAALTASPGRLAGAIALYSELRPGLDALLDGRGERVRVSARAVSLARKMLDDLAAADPVLAREIETLHLRPLLEGLSGVRFSEAWNRVAGAPRTEASSRLAAD